MKIVCDRLEQSNAISCGKWEHATEPTPDRGDSLVSKCTIVQEQKFNRHRFGPPPLQLLVILRLWKGLVAGGLLLRTPFGCDCQPKTTSVVLDLQSVSHGKIHCMTPTIPTSPTKTESTHAKAEEHRMVRANAFVDALDVKPRLSSRSPLRPQSRSVLIKTYGAPHSFSITPTGPAVSSGY